MLSNACCLEVNSDFKETEVLHSRLRFSESLVLNFHTSKSEIISNLSLAGIWLGLHLVARSPFVAKRCFGME